MNMKKKKQAHKELMDPLMFSRDAGGPIVMIAHVSPAPGHGLLFQSPPHTYTHTHTHSLFRTVFQGILFLHRVHTGLKPDPQRCPSVGVICVTPPLAPPVSGSSPLLSSQTPQPPRPSVSGDEAVIGGTHGSNQGTR